MTVLRVTQHGDYTVYGPKGCMGSDVIIRPGPCKGADVIALFSAFMDYGHCLRVFTITEEQYDPVHALKTWEQFDTWLNGVWPK